MDYRTLLNQNIEKFFEFTFTDGEKTVGKVVFVDLDANEFIYELKSTNEPTRYANRFGKYSAGFGDLKSAELLDRE
jgi:hypothetical protein